MDDFLSKYKEFNKIFKFKKIDFKSNKSKKPNSNKNNKTELIYSPYFYLTNGKESIINPDRQSDVPYYEILVEYPYLISNSFNETNYGFYGNNGFETYKSVIEKERINQSSKVNFIKFENLKKEQLFTTYFIYSNLKDLEKIIDLTELGGNIIIETTQDISSNLEKISKHFEYCEFLFSPVDLKLKVLLLNRGDFKEKKDIKTQYLASLDYYIHMVETLYFLNKLGNDIHKTLEGKKLIWFEKQIKDIQFSNAMEIIIKYELPINDIYLSEKEEETNADLNKFKNKLNLFFPQELVINGKKIKPNLSKIRLSPESVYSITPYKEAVDTVYLISSFLKKPVDFLKKLVITDGTTNVGGNMIAFCQYFKFVNGVEIKGHHVDFLKNNLGLYGFDNYNVIHGDITEQFSVLKQDLMFLDPPWGGVLYKYYDNVDLFLSGMEVSELIAKLPKETKYVGLKAPFNYRIENLQKRVDYKRMVVYNLRRYIIIMIERN